MYNAVDRAAHLHVPPTSRLSRAKLLPLVCNLPVFPDCAAEILRVARRGQINVERLVDLAGHDQVLAGALIKAANGAKYTWSGSVRSLKEAVIYIGEIRATQILVEAAIKPILAVVGHKTLWDHSLEAAAVAQRLATSSGLLRPSEAYLLGLMHDAGSLLLALTPADARAGFQALIAAGCETPVSELIMFGATHAQTGADVLRHWGMPDEYVTAVEHHHDPECGGGVGAAMLYLTEQWTEPNGDQLRDDRLEYSLESMNLCEALPYKWDHSLKRSTAKV